MAYHNSFWKSIIFFLKVIKLGCKSKSLNVSGLDLTYSYVGWQKNSVKNFKFMSHILCVKLSQRMFRVWRLKLPTPSLCHGGPDYVCHLLIITSCWWIWDINMGKMAHTSPSSNNKSNYPCKKVKVEQEPSNLKGSFLKLAGFVVLCMLRF